MNIILEEQGTTGNKSKNKSFFRISLISIIVRIKTIDLFSELTGILIIENI